MQLIVVISKSTRKGVSTFRFVEAEDGSLHAFGGIEPKAMAFTSRKQLDACVKQFLSYGYSFGIAKAKPAATPKPVKKTATKKQLPLDLQQDLWALEPYVEPELAEMPY